MLKAHESYLLAFKIETQYSEKRLHTYMGN